MHILFLTDNFPPEGNAPANRTYEHCKEWAKAGNQVTVITCAPNFPEGKIFPGYSNAWYYKETLDGIDVRRVKTYITANTGFLRRTLDYMSFMVTGFIAGLFVKKPDVIIATSPQFFCACAGWVLSVFKRKPFVFELRDIWPASISAVGAMEDSFALRLLEKLELFLYRRAALIISVTRSFCTNLVQRGIEKEKIKIILNGVDTSVYFPMKKDQGLLDKYGLANKFIVGTVGTQGMAHALETVINAAELMEGDAEIVFLFAGGGAESENLQNLIQQKKLDNILYLGRQDKKIMPAIWSLCDISIIHLRNSELFRHVIPSKIFESMAMGIPIIIGVPEGEATTMVEQDKSGIKISPESPEQMVAAIKRLKNDRKVYDHYIDNALEQVSQYERKNLASVMLKHLEELLT